MILTNFNIFNKELNSLTQKKMLINTINAYSYNVSKKDLIFREALEKCDVLIPDGIGIVLALRVLDGERIKKIAGADLFFYQMEKLEKIQGKCFFLGSTEETLLKIKERAKREYPNVYVETFSPPYKEVFSDDDNELILRKVNEFGADVIFIGMTAPKQEKWAYKNFPKIDTGHVCSIGAVFDFYAGNINRAPEWVINIGFEWFYRFLKEPTRLWRRYLLGNMKFVFYMLKEKLLGL